MISERRRLVLRPATLADVPHFDRWDRDPGVIAATSDDPEATRAFADAWWPDELAAQSEFSQYFIAELDGRPIGAMQIIDPHMEAAHYWGKIEANLRALDIWIGDAADRNRGHGERILRIALAMCFADPAVTAIVIDPLASNSRAHRFYRRLGFEPERLRRFGDDDALCLVHRLTRDAWRARFPED